MKIEREILHFIPPAEKMKALTELQNLYYQILQTPMSIEGLVQHFLRQGWLVNFIELSDLIEDLVRVKALRNPSFYQYFEKIQPAHEKSLWSTIMNLDLRGPVPAMRTYKELPFFRSLDPQLADFFLSKATIHHVPSRALICQQGDTSRDLFVLVRGTAGVYKPHQKGGKYLVATLTDHAVFGEGAFLLGHPRSADVISQTDCRILCIPGQQDVFDRVVKREKAQSMQYRFWVQHALLNSPLFKEVPADCFDALNLAGSFVRCDDGQVLFHEGEKGQSAYIVVQGSLVISQGGQNINVLGQGSIVGEIALLANQGVRSATAHAQKDTLLIEINNNEFYKLLGQNLFLGKYLQELAMARLSKDQYRIAG